MSQLDDLPPTSRARRSPLFRSRPGALQVDEWVANITLPPPPDTPLEEEDPAEQLDEHGLPSFDDDLDDPEEPGARPVRLFVGMGQPGAPVASLPPLGDDEAFLSENLDDLVSAGLPPLSLQPSLAREPLHLRRRQVAPPEPEPEPEPEPQLEPGPPPLPPLVWSRPGGASAPEPAAPEETSEQDEEPVSAPRSGKPPQVIRSRPSWAPGRPVKEPTPLDAPVFQPRESPASSVVREKLFSWTGLSILVAALIIALALWVLVRG